VTDAVGREGMQLFREKGDPVAGACIDTHCDLADTFVSQHADKHREHHDGEVVDAVIAGVFEEIQGNRFARAGLAADENEIHEMEDNEGLAVDQPAA
jgi:hypothetical protein